jgi:WD40-like Beta Propeller Repeat
MRRRASIWMRRLVLARLRCRASTRMRKRAGWRGSAVWQFTLSIPFVLLVPLFVPACAGAGFTPPALVSGTQRIQFGSAEAPAISSDSRYVVFQGSLAGVPGIYRRDLQTGAVEEVAGGDPADQDEPCSTTNDPLAACDAAAPSVSADGRYISFTTTADLQPEGPDGTPAGEPAQDAGCPEVYVRDMGPSGEPLPASAPAAYTLASALNGSGVGIAFGTCPNVNGTFAVAGAQAAPAVAISADGRHVVFTVLSTSNLTRGPSCAASKPLAECPLETPASQVAVRDLETKTTTLVSSTPQGEATPGGGAFPSAESEVVMHAATSYPNSTVGDQLTGSTAAISADASTVAWLGTNVPLQVPSATDISTSGLHGGNQSPLAFEAEPLWRRVADGDAAVTRRLLAGAGLDFYLSIGQEGAVYDGSFVAVQSALFVAPALSADGHTVAVIANAPTPAGAEEFFLYRPQEQPDTDAYAIHVEDSPASAPQVTALTSTPSYSASQGATAAVSNIAISPDGTRVAFDTARTQFALPALAFASPPSTYTGVSETYEANLALGTLQRVTSTYNGSSPNGEAGLLAFSGEGQALAFASQATNLFYGDSIFAPEVYLVRELPAATNPATQEVGATPEPTPPGVAWKLSATASAQANGSVLVAVQVPGAGRVAVSAGAQLPAPASRKAVGRKAPKRGAAGERSQVKAEGAKAIEQRPKAIETKGREKASVDLTTRTVAQAATSTGGPAQVQLRLRVAASYRALVSGRLGLYTVLRVTFATPGHPVLSLEIPVTFHAKAIKAAKAHKKKVKA